MVAASRNPRSDSRRLEITRGLLDVDVLASRNMVDGLRLVGLHLAGFPQVGKDFLFGGHDSNPSSGSSLTLTIAPGSQESSVALIVAS